MVGDVHEEGGGLMQSSAAASTAVYAVCDALLSETDAFEVQPWHSRDDEAQRDTVRTWVAHLISQRRPHAADEWCTHLADVATRVERKLFSSAASLEE